MRLTPSKMPFETTILDYGIVTHEGVDYQYEVDYTKGEGYEPEIIVSILEHGLSDDLRKELVEFVIKEIKEYYANNYSLK